MKKIILVLFVYILTVYVAFGQSVEVKKLQKKYDAYFVKYEFKTVEMFAEALNEACNLLLNIIDSELEKGVAIESIFSEDNENLQISFTIFSRLFEDNKIYAENNLITEIIEKYQKKITELQELYYQQMQSSEPTENYDSIYEYEEISIESVE